MKWYQEESPGGSVWSAQGQGRSVGVERGIVWLKHVTRYEQTNRCHWLSGTDHVRRPGPRAWAWSFVEDAANRVTDLMECVGAQLS